MTETDIKIPIEESLYIYGTLRGSFDGPLIILCHGYGGWMHEMLLFNASRYFERKGYSTLRLSMYGGGEKSRDIGKSDVMTHAHDIDAVADYVKSQGAKWVGVAGHSYSGLAIVYTKKQNFEAAALWDPTHTDGYDDPQNVENLNRDFKFDKELGVYVSSKGSGGVYAKTVFDNDYPKSNQSSKNFHIPTVVVNASWSKKQQEYGRAYSKYIDADTKHVVIPGSSHPFTEDGAIEKLYETTSRFFKSIKLPKNSTNMQQSSNPG